MEFELYKYTQIWEDKTRIIFVSDKGSVFLDITYSPNGKDKKAFIWSLNVKEEYRGKHFARVLLTSAEVEDDEVGLGYSGYMCSYPDWFERKKSAYIALRDSLKQCEEFMDDIKSLL